MKILPLHCKTVKLHTCSAMLPKLSREFWRLYQLKRFFGSRGKQYYFCATSPLAGLKTKLFWQDHRLILPFFTEVTRLLSNSLSCPLPAKIGGIWSSHGCQCLQDVEKLRPQSSSEPAAAELRVSDRTVSNRGPCPLQHTRPRCGGIMWDGLTLD